MAPPGGKGAPEDFPYTHARTRPSYTLHTHTHTCTHIARPYTPIFPPTPTPFLFVGTPIYPDTFYMYTLTVTNLHTFIHTMRRHTPLSHTFYHTRPKGCWGNWLFAFKGGSSSRSTGLAAGPPAIFGTSPALEFRGSLRHREGPSEPTPSPAFGGATGLGGGVGAVAWPLCVACCV